MTRYFACKGRSQRIVASWDDEYPMLPALSVPDHEAADTGLVDKDGDPIMRAPNPMGFHWGDN